MHAILIQVGKVHRRKMVADADLQSVLQLLEFDLEGDEVQDGAATKYIFGEDRRVVKITDGEGIQYFSKDHLGSSNVVTDDSAGGSGQNLGSQTRKIPTCTRLHPGLVPGLIFFPFSGLFIFL